jgi:hypothetical protein
VVLPGEVILLHSGQPRDYAWVSAEREKQVAAQVDVRYVDLERRWYEFLGDRIEAEITHSARD